MYQERERNLILRFLAGCSLDSIVALNGLETNCQNADYARIHEETVRYHVHKIQAIAELALKTTYRQRHLIEMDDEQFQRIMHTWKLGHLLSSGQGADGRSVSDSPISEATNQAGQPSEERSKETSEDTNQ